MQNQIYLYMMESDEFYQLCELLSKSDTQEAKTSAAIAEHGGQNPSGHRNELSEVNGRPCTPSLLELNLRQPSTRNNSNSRRSQVWTLTDETFLTGIVLDTYRRRHSLRPCRREEKHSRRKRRGTDVWTGIALRYEIARQRYQRLSGREIPRRTVRALEKRWKLSNRQKEDKVDRYGNFLQTSCSSKQLETLWDTRYNVGLILTCPREEYLLQLKGRLKKAPSMEPAI